LLLKLTEIGNVDGKYQDNYRRRAAGAARLLYSAISFGKTREYMQHYGNFDQEALLFWAGVKINKSVFVTSCIYPNVSHHLVTINNGLVSRDSVDVHTLVSPY
jgi:hypothetical protein